MPEQRRTLHKCFAPGCKALVPLFRLTCGKHWRKIPKALQARVYIEFRSEGGARPATLREVLDVLAQAEVARG